MASGVIIPAIRAGGAAMRYVFKLFDEANNITKTSTHSSLEGAKKAAAKQGVGNPKVLKQGLRKEKTMSKRLVGRKSGKQVGSVPTPKRKPKKSSVSAIDKYLTSPRRVGIGPSEMLGRPPIKEEKVPVIKSSTEPHVRRPKGWKTPPPNTRRDKALQRFLDQFMMKDELKLKNKGGKVIYKAEGSKVINKKKKRKTGSLPITVVDRETGKEDPSEARRIRRNTAMMELEYIPEMATPGLNSTIQRLVNDAKRQFAGPERARAMRTARKVADHPLMQEKGLTGSRSKPLDAPRKHGGGMSHAGLDPAEEKHQGKTKATGTVSEATREENIKREAKGGGKVLETKKKKKKKQGYKARKDESIAQRVKKKRTKKQLKASRDESYGKWGKGKGKGKINQTDGNKLVASLYD